MTSKIKQRLFTIVFMLAVTIVFISVVSGIHLATADIVRRNATLYMREAIIEATGLTVPDSPEATLSLYDQMSRAIPNEQNPAYYRVTNPESGKTGYVLVASGPGLWGNIKAVIGLNSNLSALTGVSFVEHNETPGLGARITEPWFKAQLAGKCPPLSLVPEGTRSTATNEIDAITGATVTSTAVRDILNRAMDNAKQMIRENEIR